MNLFDFNLDKALRQVHGADRDKLLSELTQLRQLLQDKDIPLLQGGEPLPVPGHRPPVAGDTQPLFPPAPDRLRRLVGSNAQPDAATRAKQSNPFLPHEAIAALEESRQQAAKARAAVPAQPATTTAGSGLRDTAYRLIDEIIEERLSIIRQELRFQLRQEIERRLPELQKSPPQPGSDSL